MVHCSPSQGCVWFGLHWKVSRVLPESSSPLFWSTCVPAPCPCPLPVKTEETPEEANPSVGRCLSLSSQRPQASVAGRLNCVSARSRLENTQTRTRCSSGFVEVLLPVVLLLPYCFFQMFCSRLRFERECALLLLSFFPFYLIGPPSAFPWTIATNIAQVCCGVLKTWQRVLRNARVFSICISLSTLVLFPRCSSCSSAISVTKTCFSSASNLQSIIFLWGWRICPLSWRS